MGGKESLPTTARGSRYIFVAIDCFTKYAVAVPLPDQTAQSVARAFLSSWILVFGPPRRVHADQGLCFESDLFNQLCTVWRIAKSRTTPYHPQGNGVCERVNQTIKNSLRRVQVPRNPDEWDLTLPVVLFAYNTSIHSATGFTPFFLTHGCEARLPSDLIVPVVDHNSGSYASTLVHIISSACTVARETLHTNQQREKDYYDTGAVTRLFQPGDVVRLRVGNLFNKPASKLASPWSGQYEVVEVRGVNVKIRSLHSNEQLWAHHDRLSNPQVFRERVLPPRANPARTQLAQSEPGSSRVRLPASTSSAPRSAPASQPSLQVFPVHETCSNVADLLHSAAQSVLCNSVEPVGRRFTNLSPLEANTNACFLLPALGARASMSSALRYTHPPTPLPAAMQQAISELRPYGIRPQWITGWERFFFMHPRTGTLYYLSATTGKWISMANAATTEGAPGGGLVLTDLTAMEPWEPAGLQLVPAHLRDLPEIKSDFPEGGGITPSSRMYGQMQVWLDFAVRRHNSIQNQLLQATAQVGSFAPQYQTPSVAGPSFPAAASAAQHSTRQPPGPYSTIVDENPECETGGDSPTDEAFGMLSTVSMAGVGYQDLRPGEYEQHEQILRRATDLTAHTATALAPSRFAVPTSPGTTLRSWPCTRRSPVDASSRYPEPAEVAVAVSGRVFRVHHVLSHPASRWINSACLLPACFRRRRHTSACNGQTQPTFQATDHLGCRSHRKKLCRLWRPSRFECNRRHRRCS